MPYATSAEGSTLSENSFQPSPCRIDVEKNFGSKTEAKWPAAPTQRIKQVMSGRNPIGPLNAALTKQSARSKSPNKVDASRRAEKCRSLRVKARAYSYCA
jgi:hypothetical protein